MAERHLKAVPDQPALISDPDQPRGPRVCAWCGQPASTMVMVSPPVFASRKGRRVETKSSVWADSCREHRHHAYNPHAQPAVNRQAAYNERRRLRLAAKDQTTIDDFLEGDPPAS